MRKVGYQKKSPGIRVFISYMNSNRLKKIEEIYHASLEIEPEKQALFLEKECGEDKELKKEIEALLYFEENPIGLIDTPPEDLAAEIFSHKEDSQDLINKTIGRYKVEKILGEGGMGTVFLAKDGHLARNVAVKVLSAEIFTDKNHIQRFKQEARAVSKLNHPNILTVYEIGQTDETHYIATEFIEGKSLKDHLKDGRLQLTSILDIAIQIVSALKEAHSAGIIHRDIKPDNIMIRPDGLVKILDFGIAKLIKKENFDTDSESKAANQINTISGMIMGTAKYMSPEQARGHRVDARTDLFSFGVLLYEMVSGKQPFTGETVNHTIVAILENDPPPFSRKIPLELIKIIKKALEKNRDDRYSSAKDLLTDLKNLQSRLVIEGHTEHSSDYPYSTTDSSGDSTSFSSLNKDEALSFSTFGGDWQTPLIGRNTERQALKRLLESAYEGRGKFVLLSGEAGVGKTRLATEILKDGRRSGMLALAGHANENQTVPFITITEILEEIVRQVPESDVRELLGKDASEISRLLPELRNLFSDIPEPENLPPEQQQRVLFNSVFEFCKRVSIDRPLVMLFDDIHWADESSLLLIENLAKRISELSILMIGTYRDIEADMGKPFAKELPVMIRRRLAERLTIKDFDENAVNDLLAALGGDDPPQDFVKLVHRGTEGNPFFIEEVFYHLSEEEKLFDEKGKWNVRLQDDALEVPEGVRLVIGRRLKRLKEKTRKVLSTAATIGLRFDLPVLETAVGDLDEVLEGIEEAESAFLIKTVKSKKPKARYEFNHALVRQTLIGEISIPRLQRLHLLIADSMETIYGENADKHSADIAHQLLAAGTRAKASRTRRFLTLAGDLAQASAAAEEAHGFYARALEFDEGIEQREQAELLFKRGMASRSLGDWEKAAADWNEALPLLESEGRSDFVTLICWEIAYQKIWQSEFEEAVEIATRGLASAGDGASVGRSRLLALLGQINDLAGNFEGGDKLLTESVEMAENLGDERLLGGEVLHSRIYHYYYTQQITRAVSVSERALKLSQKFGRPWDISSAFGLLALHLPYAGQFARAKEIADEAFPFATQEGDKGTLGHVYATRATYALTQGDFKKSREGFKECEKIFREAGFPWFTLCLSLDGWIAMLEGDFKRARKKHEEAVQFKLSGPFTGLEEACYLRFLVFAGDEKARSLMEELESQLPNLEKKSGIGSWILLSSMVESAITLGFNEKAAKLLPLIEQKLAEGMVATHPFELTERIAGMAATAGGLWEDAEKHFQNALRQAKEIPHLPEQGEVRRWYAKMLNDRNAPEDAERSKVLLSEAQEIFQKIGMLKHQEIVENMWHKV